MSPYMLLVSLAVVALETGPQVATAKAEPATSIERALIERACGTPYTPWADDNAQQCFSDHLLTLRTDFGRDLSKLSTADRKAMDVACRDLRRPEQQDVYVDCLSGQLVAIHDRQDRRLGIAHDPTVDASMVPALAGAEAMPASQASTWRRTAMVGVILATVIAGGGLGFLAVRPRRTRRRCRVCGVDAPGADLCATCRHAAAEAVKRDVAERTRHASMQEEESRQQCVAEAEQSDVSGLTDVGLLTAPVVEDHVSDPLEGLGDVRVDGPADDQLEKRADNRLDETVEEAEETASVFDPYVVLGVPRDAAQDAIGTAYELARKRYDPEQVSFLGYDAQEHFRVKAESVERAYQMLSST